MVQTQEDTKELQQVTEEEIYFPDEEINEEITKERKEEIHSLMEDTREKFGGKERRKSFSYRRN